MIAVALSLLVVLALVVAAGAADKRWPDRLSRRGRRLTGLSAEPVEPRASSKPMSRRAAPILERGTPKSELYSFAFGSHRSR